MVADYCLRVGGRIIENLHHFLSVYWLFSIIQLQLCSVLPALSGQLRVHRKKLFLRLAGHFCICMDLVLGSCLLGAPVGALWICNLVMFPGAVSAVV